MTADFKQGANLAGGILASGQLTAETLTTVYTVPAGSAVKIATFALCNDSGSATAVVSVTAVPAGQTATGARLVVSQYPLAPRDSTKIVELEGAFLGEGDFITIKSSGTGCNYTITGAVSS